MFQIEHRLPILNLLVHKLCELIILAFYLCYFWVTLNFAAMKIAMLDSML